LTFSGIFDRFLSMIVTIQETKNYIQTLIKHKEAAALEYIFGGLKQVHNTHQYTSPSSTFLKHNGKFYRYDEVNEQINLLEDEKDYARLGG
jgi:hypothetical protein